MHVYLNGQFLRDEDARISVFDGGFLYGDGVYTTLRVYHGRAVDLPAHFHRLVAHARSLDISLNLDLPAMNDIVTRLVALNGLTASDGRLRITVSRSGSAADPLPLTDLDLLEPTVLATLAPVGPHLAAWQNTGISAVVLGPAFARSHFPELKTLNGLTTVLALRQAARNRCQEAILTAHGGFLLEGAVSNIFLVRQEELWTPACRGGFLPGRTRERVMALSRKLGLGIREESLTTADLAASQEVFCASSVREILPVISIDHRPVGTGRPGPVTRRIQEAYHDAMNAEFPDAC